MLINNLKTIKNLLQKPVSKSKVDCARILLDGCIEYLEKKPESKNFLIEKHILKNIEDNPSSSNYEKVVDEDSELSEEARLAKEDLIQ